MQRQAQITIKFITDGTLLENHCKNLDTDLKVRMEKIADLLFANVTSTKQGYSTIFVVIVTEFSVSVV
jgi:hypothetical protein